MLPRRDVERDVSHLMHKPARKQGLYAQVESIALAYARACATKKRAVYVAAP